MRGHFIRKGLQHTDNGLVPPAGGRVLAGAIGIVLFRPIDDATVLLVGAQLNAFQIGAVITVSPMLKERRADGACRSP